MFCSRKEPFGFELPSQTLEKIEFFIFWWKCKLLFFNYCFSSFFDWGHFWLHVDRWCFAVVFYCRCRATNHIYIILLPVSTLWYIICSLFNRALVRSEFLSQSKFPITSWLYHSAPQWLPTFPDPQKRLEVPLPPLHPSSYFPINQWNYFRNPHYRVVTKGIPLTTVVLYVEFIYRSSSSFSSHLSWYPLTPPTPSPSRVLTQLHTGQLHV